MEDKGDLGLCPSLGPRAPHIASRGAGTRGPGDPPPTEGYHTEPRAVPVAPMDPPSPPLGLPPAHLSPHDQGPGLGQGRPAQPVARTQLERQLLSHWPELAVGLLRREEGL